jgi:hypothetical protein
MILVSLIQMCDTMSSTILVALADVPDTKYITIIYTEDVLFGRGSGPNDHEGNIRFRNNVAERKAEYMAKSHRVTKTNIARDIVNLVISVNGRFKKVRTRRSTRIRFSIITW